MQESNPQSLPAKDTQIRCCVCGTVNWWRCKPGESADATPYPPHMMSNVAVLPGEPREMVAWCRACDPVLR